MSEMSAVKKSIFCAACISLCVVLPLLFGAIPGMSAVYWLLQMPVMVCGLVCGASCGLLCGVAGPIVSWTVSGAPPALIMPPLLCECALYGLVSGGMMRVLHMKKIYSDLYISLISAILVGKAASGAIYALIYTDGAYSLSAWTAGSLFASLPGAIVQLALIPSIVYALMRAGLIAFDYPT